MEKESKAEFVQALKAALGGALDDPESMYRVLVA